jgi:tetratricopeptide (TPR) repeat protein
VTRTVSPEAFDAYLRGLELRGHPNLGLAWGPQTIEQFERAVQLDPNFAEAWVELARTRSMLGTGLDAGFRSELPKARDAAQRALTLDDDLVGAHTVLGNIRLWYDWDFAGARRAYERAVQLSPSSPYALNGYMWYLMNVEGEIEEALDLAERMLRVAPLDLFYRRARVSLFLYARRCVLEAVMGGTGARLGRAWLPPARLAHDPCEGSSLHGPPPLRPPLPRPAPPHRLPGGMSRPGFSAESGVPQVRQG